MIKIMIRNVLECRQHMSFPLLLHSWRILAAADPAGVAAVAAAALVL
jgi:hypothetical protein